MAADGLGSADGADALPGLGLDVDQPGVQIQEPGHVGTDVGLARL